MSPRHVIGGLSEAHVQNGRQKNVYLCLTCVRALCLVHHGWPRSFSEMYQGRELGVDGNVIEAGAQH